MLGGKFGHRFRLVFNKLPKLFGARVQRPMVDCCHKLHHAVNQGVVGLTDAVVAHCLPNVIHRHGRRMAHIGIVEAVVAKVVEQELVRWKIVRVRKPLNKLIDSQ